MNWSLVNGFMFQTQTVKLSLIIFYLSSVCDPDHILLICISREMLYRQQQLTYKMRTHITSAEVLCRGHYLSGLIRRDLKGNCTFIIKFISDMYFVMQSSLSVTAIKINLKLQFHCSLKLCT